MQVLNWWSSDHCRRLHTALRDGLLHLHLFPHLVFHLLFPLIFSDHHVIFCDFLHHLAFLYLAHPRLHDLLLEDALTYLSVHLVTTLVLTLLLVLQSHQQVAFFLVLRLESFLFLIAAEESRAAILMYLHHLLLLLLKFLLVTFKLFVLYKKKLAISQSIKVKGKGIIT